MTNELERQGIPTVFVSNLRSVAAYMRVNRYLPGVAIPHVFGNPSLPPDEERQLRRRMVEQALALLQSPGEAAPTPPAERAMEPAR